MSVIEWTKDQRTLLAGYLNSVFDSGSFRVHGNTFKDAKPESKKSCLNGMMIGIDGPIGSGKTSLGIDLQREVGNMAKFEKEQVDPVWLDLFYKKPKRYAEVFQVNQLAACARVTKIMEVEARHGAVAIIDRTPLGNFCFAALQLLEENISKEVFVGYLSTFKKSGYFAYTEIIYLLVNPETAKKRIEARARRDPDRTSEVEAVDLNYLIELDRIMLFATLYAKARGVLQISFIDWGEFGSAAQIIKQILCTDSKKNLVPDPELQNKIMTADYDELKRIAKSMCVDISSNESQT